MQALKAEEFNCPPRSLKTAADSVKSVIRRMEMKETNSLILRVRVIIRD
jgi:hypothetical protein